MEENTAQHEEPERNKLYQRIGQMYDYALAPLPDDPPLDAWRRERAIMQALAKGEVLPTTKHQLFCRSDEPWPSAEKQAERKKIANAQSVLEKLCPKYTDAFKEHDRDNLSKWIAEAEEWHERQREERRDIFRVAHISEVQDHLFAALELAHKFARDPKVRKRIEDGTRAIKEQWEKDASTDGQKPSYAGIAKRGMRVCDAYLKLINELYSMNDVTPDAQSGVDFNDAPSASIEQNRTDISNAISKLMQAVQELGRNQERTANGVDFLVGDRQKTKAANTERGKENQTKGNTEERDRAAADRKIALKRVHDDPNVKAGKHGALMTACRRVCREFKSLTNKKNALGKYEEYAPLTGAGGEQIQPETLAKNYREKYGARKPCRSGASTK